MKRVKYLINLYFVASGFVMSAFLFSCSASMPLKPGELKKGDAAPEFSLFSVKGQKYSLSEYKMRKKAVLVFFSSTCGPCKKEIPELLDLKKKTPSINTEFLFMAVEKDEDEIKKFIIGQGWKFDVLMDIYEETAKSYKLVENDSVMLPGLFPVDQFGVIAFSQVGYNEKTVEVLGELLNQ